MSVAEKNLTPMMRQYRRIKSKLPDGVLLFFRLGDFYEMFYDDAIIASECLDIVLTKRNNVPMCGVPVQSRDNYIAKLLRAGYRVAICEQVEDPSVAKGIVRRELSCIITAGTAVDGLMDEKSYHYLTSIYHYSDTEYAVVFLDFSTGNFWGKKVSSKEKLLDELMVLQPVELIVSESEKGLVSLLSGWSGENKKFQITQIETWIFEFEFARDTLLKHFKVYSLDTFGCEKDIPIVCAAGALIFYVKERLFHNINHVSSFSVRHENEYMILDESTCFHLDLIPRRGVEDNKTLLGVIDCTLTPMGGRKLKEWLLHPLISAERIKLRQDAVEFMVNNRHILKDIRNVLKGIKDIERFIGRLNRSDNPRDLKLLVDSLEKIPRLKSILAEVKDVPLINDIDKRIVPVPEVVELVSRAIVDEPPSNFKEGGVIKEGFSKELDEIRNITKQGHNWIADYQVKEQQRTGIKTLRIGYNKVFGYYIEVSRGQAKNVPSDYIRKQTLTNSERFISPQLKEWETKILGAEEKAFILEKEIFDEVKAEVLDNMLTIQRTADAIGELDVIAAFAERAISGRYIRPVVDDSDMILIKAGRHPVIETIPELERFIPNDTLLDTQKNQLIIITGPNMAGKSTYIRQVALIVIMAQIGSFIPADDARIGIVDRVFTRVGSSDDIGRGRSTFLVEMQETANILHNATSRSLIVLDEIGRGTSTFDGISIAWAVAEYLYNTPSCKARTLFATHYHELTELEDVLTGVKNYTVTVKETENSIIFLRKIVRGKADRSYGIQVAQLAGLPRAVTERAREILKNLEEGEFLEGGIPRLAKPRSKQKNNEYQLRFFE